MPLKLKRDTSAFPESLTAATKWLSETVGYRQDGFVVYFAMKIKGRSYPQYS